MESYVQRVAPVRLRMPVAGVGTMGNDCGLYALIVCLVEASGQSLLKQDAGLDGPGRSFLCSY